MQGHAALSGGEFGVDKCDPVLLQLAHYEVQGRRRGINPVEYQPALPDLGVQPLRAQPDPVPLRLLRWSCQHHLEGRAQAPPRVQLQPRDLHFLEGLHFFLQLELAGSILNFDMLGALEVGNDCGVGQPVKVDLVDVPEDGTLLLALEQEDRLLEFVAGVIVHIITQQQGLREGFICLSRSSSCSRVFSSSRCLTSSTNSRLVSS